jgi:hypothetical protein
MPSLRLLVLLPLAACTGNVQRSARVPHPGVPLISGQPLQTPAELSAGLSNVADLIAPTVGDHTQAVEVPGTEMRDELRFRIGPRADLALLYEHGFGGTSHRPDPTQAPVGPGDVLGYGLGLNYSFATTTPGLAIGTTFELMSWSVPFVEYTTCTSCEAGGPTTISHGRADPVTLGIGVTPSYRTGRVTLFGGAFARNHPTTTRKEVDVDITFSDDGAVHDGPFNVLLHAGVEVELERWLSAMLLVHQDLASNPVQYGPGIGVALTARLGGGS